MIEINSTLPRIHMEPFTTVYHNFSPPGYSWETIDIDYWRAFISQHFYEFIPALGVLYLSGIYFGQKWMKNRPPFQFTNTLIIWNAALAIFSGIVFWKGMEDMLLNLKMRGVHVGVCERSPISKVSGFWAVLFLFSKIFELGDTLFLVLRKKPVIFLHWFHHFTVLLTAFYIFPRFEPVPLLSGLINAGVHTAMYTYFALMAYGVKVPKKLAMSITLIQILQFITVLSGTLYALYVKVTGGTCQFSYETIQYYMFLGSIYLTLFSKIFLDNYKKLKKPKAD